ncbi:MAG: hypothetical protein ACR2JB_10855 [Bryobacteraceae bacterium]
MPFEESPKIKYERLQRRLQEEILSNYPNPERKDCPGEAVLKTLASRPVDESMEGDPNWQHVTHCSECYREFLGFQSATTQRNKVRKEALRWGFAGAVVLVALAIFLFVRGAGQNGSKRPQNAELAYSPRTINIESMTRSATGGGEKKPFFLDRDREALTIQLPVGSKAGKYEFQLRDQADRVIVTKSAVAAINGGVTTFLIRVDLSGLHPGQYKMEVRQVPWDWDYYPVVLR